MKIKTIRLRLSALCIIVAALVLWGYCQDEQNIPVRPLKVADDLYWAGDFECNVAALVGPDGVLIVDSGGEEVTDKVRSALLQVSKEPVRIIMNTHFHFDHVGGNEAFARGGALVISQEKARERMTVEWRPREILGVRWPNLPPYSTPALAKVCYAESLTVHFNGEEIEALHLPAAHSDGDAVIRFKRANVVHTGDLYLSNGFPVIDIDTGGTIGGYLAGVDKIINLCDDKTVVIPGHGAVSDREGLRSYRDMLTTARDRIAKLIKGGKTLEQIVAADVTAGLFKGGESWLEAKLYVYCVYMDLTREGNIR